MLIGVYIPLMVQYIQERIYKQSHTYQLHLQLVKGNVIKAPTKTKAQQKQRDIQDKVGKSLNNPEVKDLVGVKTKKETKEILESGRKTRSMTAGTTRTLRDRKTN